MIGRILEDGQPVGEVTRGFGISARTARKWLARFKAGVQVGRMTIRPAQRPLPIVRASTGSA
ncbi:hypothetical protein JH26_05725 [Microvirga sp. BSC39]|nr:hypothetical protein JH26_05725 [Microvirga sp. BSC39]